MTSEDLQASNVALSDEVRRTQESLKIALLTIDKLKVELARPSGHDGECPCLACGRALREIGKDISEVLDYEPGSFHVVRHVRPRMACAGCKTIAQVAATSRPVERGMAGAGLLAHVLVGKYADHLPLYRQCQIYAR